MLVGGSNTAADNTAFNMYTKGIAPGSCTTPGQSNHQVTMVGYGHYQGTPVWLMLNSWGTSWGVFGFFMVAQGANSFCIEADVNGIIPRYRGFD